MDRQELITSLNSVLNNKDGISTVVYAVLKGSNEIKQLNIVNTEISYIQKMFVESIKSTIIDVEEQGLILVSEADDRANTIFEYDLELPNSLNYITSKLNDKLPKFSFLEDDLGSIESLLIEIGTEKQQLTLIKQLSPVEVFGRGGYMLWKSNNQLERFEDKILRLTPKFNGLIIEDTIIFTELNLLERSHGFHDIIVREAEQSLKLIEAINILENTDGIKALLTNTSFARKVLKLKNSPVLKNKIPNTTIIAFTRTHPALAKRMKYSDDGSQIILKTKIAKELFIKMLDDAYLTSELTKQFYESKAKDEVHSEEDETVTEIKHDDLM